MKTFYRTGKRSLSVRLSLIAFLLFSSHAFAQLSVTPGVPASTLVSSLLGGGLNVSNITINCPSNAYGTFTNGNTTNIGVNNGILLTTGSATNAIGPNNIGSMGTCNGTSVSDPQLVAIEPFATHDVCVLEFDLVPNCNTLQIRWVFGSEEYPEFVNGGFNDAFGFFITGPGPACQPNFYNNQNIATLPNNVTIVSIDNVNNGTTNSGPCVNCAYYVNNTGGTTIQYDAFTTVLTRSLTLCPCQTYHFKLAIADAGDCNYDSGVFVDFMQCSTALTALTSFTPPTSCSVCDGTATANPSGGNPPYNYVWAPGGQTTQTITGLCPGAYTCTITDQGGCTAPQTVVVTIPNNGGINSAQSNLTNVSCNGGSNGSATVTGSGGTGVYTYSWAPSGNTNSTATGLPAGTYTVTVTDSGGCISMQTVTITQPTAINPNLFPTDPSCNGSTNGSITTITSGGAGSYTYSWSPSGGTAATASNLGAGSYTVTVTDANGCSVNQSTTLTQPPAIVPNPSSVPATCGNANGSATVAPTGGAGSYTYAWAPAGGNAATANGLPAGTYTCTITDASGCSTTQAFNITQSPAVTATASGTNVTCGGGSNGTATVNPSGGSGTLTFAWAPAGGNAATATNLPAGSYTCTITDSLGCTSLQVVNITQPPAITSTNTVTNVTCNGSGNGSITVNASGGAGGYTYSWSPSGGNAATASNLSGGSYTCTITDANGCSIQDSATIIEPAVLSASAIVAPMGCSPTTSATANVTGGTGPYTYSWSPSGGTGQTENGLGAGSYTLAVTDANGCAMTTQFTIVPSSPITVTSSFNAPTCFNGANGTATVAPSGGNPPYTYSWSPSGGTNATATGLGAGTYTCTITDANGCSTTQTVTLTQPTAIVASTTSTGTSCFGGSNGSASTTASGGTGSYTYSWAPSGGSAATANGLSAATYTVTITDANGCIATQSITVTQPTQVVASATGSIICEGQSTSVIGAGTGGTSPYTYVWSNGPTGAIQAVNVTQTTSYTVTVTDANGCTDTEVATVTVNPAPVATISSNATNGFFPVISASPSQLCFTGPSNVASWSWDLNGTTTSTIQNPCVAVTSANVGTYCASLIVQSSAGCIDSASICIEITNSFYSIPNVFTPNSDGSNDNFVITNEGMKSLHCTIYNRWGEIVYQWDGTTGYWDGKQDGKEVQDGVYYFTAHLVDYTDTVYEESGFIHLISGKQ